MSELLKEFKQYLRENEESYKNGARDSIEYPLGYEEVKLLLNEIERLNNIINELEKYIKTDAKIELYKDVSGFRTFVDGQDLLNKLQELKGSYSNEQR